jgi:hypothetical protein
MSIKPATQAKRLEQAKRRMEVSRAYHERGNMTTVGSEFGISRGRVNVIVERFIRLNCRGLTATEFRKQSIDWSTVKLL